MEIYLKEFLPVQPQLQFSNSVMGLYVPETVSNADKTPEMAKSISAIRS
jgi:hypothetical protein